MKTRRSAFLSGCLTTLLLLTLGTSVLAASGQISFNVCSVAVDGETEITAGSAITASNGQQIPSSILYTDAAGGGTNYLPLRTISQLLGVEVGYDATTKTAYIGQWPETAATAGKRWKKEVDGRTVTYFCEEEGHIYTTPLTYRPTWQADGWGLDEMSHDVRNYTTSWQYSGPEGTVTMQCAYPSTAGFGRQMNSTEAIENCQTVTVQGYRADYYQDGNFHLLVWENPEGILFYLSGKNVTRDLLIDAAESVEPCTATVGTYSLGWLPQGYSRMERYVIADTQHEYWVRDGVALSWMASGSELSLPDWESSAVDIRDMEGQFWEAEELHSSDDKEEDPDTGDTGVTITTAIIPGEQGMNTLAWQDPDTGLYFRLQSILDRNTMLRIAERVEQAQSSGQSGSIA